MLQNKNHSLWHLVGNASSPLIQQMPWSAESLFLSQAVRTRWSARFKQWAQPLSNTENQKCQNAENMVRNALNGYHELNGLNIRVFAQGSYWANTNVKYDSDVDICALCDNVFLYELPVGITRESLGFVTAELDYGTYRAKVGKALNDAFTARSVSVGNKAFTITENTHRIVADVVPTFEYRKYYRDNTYISGVCFITSDGKFIVNWPEQTHSNGVAKNNRTNRRYKRVVRVLKGLRNEMEEKGYASAKKISSFQISCLAYNVPDICYNQSELYDDVKTVAKLIRSNTFEAFRSSMWTEVDGIKSLFPSDQPGKAKEVADFFWDLMNYVELQG